MGNINLGPGSDFPSFVLIHLFKDAMAKLGRAKKAVVSDMNYNVVDGLTVVDGNGVTWNVQVNAKVCIPQELIDDRVEDNKAKSFCVECTTGMAEEKRLCSVCEYLEKI
jgi:hypothetical protein